MPQHRLKLLSGALRQHDMSSALSFSRSIAKDYGTVLLPEVQTRTRSFNDFWSEETGNFVADLRAAEQGMRLDACYTLPDEYLQKVDVASMSFSLESREPLLDHKLVEWSMKLPLEWKLRAGKNKYLFRKLAYRYLPRAILDRPKQGFCVPINEWLRGPLNTWARERIHERRLFEILPLDQARVIDLFDLHKSGLRNVHPLLWAVLMLLDYIDTSK
jgi:asparagine synthase (glutamine-hydrolysing)